MVTGQTDTFIITSFFVFGVKVHVLIDFSIIRVIELKLGRRVSSQTLVSYFLSILPRR